MLGELAPCSLHSEHVKLSAQRSRWSIGLALPVVFSHTPFYLSPPSYHISPSARLILLSHISLTFGFFSLFMKFLVFCSSVSL